MNLSTPASSIPSLAARGLCRLPCGRLSPTGAQPFSGSKGVGLPLRPRPEGVLSRTSNAKPRSLIAFSSGTVTPLKSTGGSTGGRLAVINDEGLRFGWLEGDLPLPGTLV